MKCDSAVRADGDCICNIHRIEYDLQANFQLPVCMRWLGVIECLYPRVLFYYLMEPKRQILCRVCRHFLVCPFSYNRLTKTKIEFILPMPSIFGIKSTSKWHSDTQFLHFNDNVVDLCTLYVCVKDWMVALSRKIANQIPINWRL